MGIADSLYKSIEENGFEEIEKMVERNESESTYIDYKLVDTLFHDGTLEEGRKKSVDRISDNDKSNLGKAISGFANSDGGIIVWGVECKDKRDGQGDVPGSFQFEIEPCSRGGISPFPLTRFKALLEDCTKYCTVPVHGEVYHRVVPKEQGTEGTTKEGVVITYVKEAQYDVIRYVKDKNEQLYYMRVGSSFELMPHSVMAARFGRKPFPRIVSRMYLQGDESAIRHHGEVRLKFCLIIENNGLGVAKDYYILFDISQMKEDIVSFTPDEGYDDLHHESDGINHKSVYNRFPYLMCTKGECLIPPRYKRKFSFSLVVGSSDNNPDRPPYEDFSIRVRTGSSCSMPESNEIIITGDHLYKLLEFNSKLKNMKSVSSRMYYLSSHRIDDIIKKINDNHTINPE